MAMIIGAGCGPCEESRRGSPRMPQYVGVGISTLCCFYLLDLETVWWVARAGSFITGRLDGRVEFQVGTGEAYAFNNCPRTPSELPPGKP